MTAILELAHSPKTHKLDAKGIAHLFGLSLPALARILDENLATVKTRSSSPKLQPKLKPLALAYDDLAMIFPTEHIPKWLRHPMRRLGGLTPLELLERHDITQFEALITEIAEGAYS